MLKNIWPVIRTGDLLSVILSSALQYASIALFADDAALSHSSSCLGDFGQKLDIVWFQKISIPPLRKGSDFPLGGRGGGQFA